MLVIFLFYIPFKFSKNFCRYNALHIASRENQALMVRTILTAIQDLNFQRLMYGENSACNSVSSAEESNRIEHLTDLYLNTPDKHAGETPLHFGCKLGYVGTYGLTTHHSCLSRTHFTLDFKMISSVVLGQRCPTCVRPSIITFAAVHM